VNRAKKQAVALLGPDVRPSLIAGGTFDAVDEGRGVHALAAISMAKIGSVVRNPRRFGGALRIGAMACCRIGAVNKRWHGFG
jgi:hypothetical protein